MANLLTGIRLFLAIPVAYSFANPEFMPAILLLLAVLVGITTDWLDGKVARALNTASPGGQLFDHSTDCFFVSTGLAGAASAGAIPWALPILVPLSFAQYVLDSYFLYHQKQLRMSRLGRSNGILYFAPLLALAVIALFPEGILKENLLITVSLIAWILIGTTVISMLDRGLAPIKLRNSD